MRTPIDPTLNDPTGDARNSRTSSEQAQCRIRETSPDRITPLPSAERRIDNTAPKYGPKSWSIRPRPASKTTTSNAKNAAGDDAVNRNVASDDRGRLRRVWLQYRNDGYTDVVTRCVYKYDNRPVDQRDARQVVHSDVHVGVPSLSYCSPYHWRSRPRRRWRPFTVDRVIPAAFFAVESSFGCRSWSD